MWLGACFSPWCMRCLVPTVGVLLVLSGSARAGQPVPQPKAPLVTRGYKVAVTVVKSSPKPYSVPSVLPMKTMTVPVKSVLVKSVTIKPVLPKVATHTTLLQVTHPTPVTVTMPRRVTRVTHIKVRTLSQTHGSSISLLKAALLSSSSLGTPVHPRQVERRVQTRLQPRPRRAQREATPQPSLLRTLQYQFDLVQMSEALGQ